MTFTQFMRRADRVVAAVGDTGFDTHCYADAPWRDLFDDLGEEATDTDICECLAEWDDTFAALYALSREDDAPA